MLDSNEYTWSLIEQVSIYQIWELELESELSSLGILSMVTTNQLNNEPTLLII